MTQNNISGVILAAGASKRMVENKILLPFRGKTVIEYVVAHLLEANLSELIVVGGRDFEMLSKVLAQYPVKCVENPNYLEGQSTSVKVGLSHISKLSKGCFFFMGDQPLIKAASINQMIALFNSEQNANTIVIPQGKEGRGTPVLFGEGHFQALSHISGDQGGRSIIQNTENERKEFFIDDPSFFWDIDTPEMYQRVRAYADTFD